MCERIYQNMQWGELPQSIVSVLFRYFLYEGQCPLINLQTA